MSKSSQLRFLNHTKKIVLKNVISDVILFSHSVDRHHRFTLDQIVSIIEICRTATDPSFRYYPGIFLTSYIRVLNDRKFLI